MVPFEATVPPGQLTGPAGPHGFVDSLGGSQPRVVIPGYEILDELGHGGSYTQEGLWVRGIIRPEDVNDYWARMQRVRYEAESGVDRMKNIKGFNYDTDANAARANLLGGFANRLLGESVCQAVINDGPVQSDTTYFQRAEAEFTEAIRIAAVAIGRPSSSAR